MLVRFFFLRFALSHQFIDLSLMWIDLSNCNVKGAYSYDAVLSSEEDRASPRLQGIVCNGTEETVANCILSGIPMDSCKYDVAGINCLVEPKVGQEGDIRLFDNSTSPSLNRASGLLQVFNRGRWKNFCTSGFTSNDAAVACRQLGYHDEGMYHRSLLKPVQHLTLNRFAYVS